MSNSNLPWNDFRQFPQIPSLANVVVTRNRKSFHSVSNKKPLSLLRPPCLTHKYRTHSSFQVQIKASASFLSSSLQITAFLISGPAQSPPLLWKTKGRRQQWGKDEVLGPLLCLQGARLHLVVLQDVASSSQGCSVAAPGAGGWLTACSTWSFVVGAAKMNYSVCQVKI